MATAAQIAQISAYQRNRKSLDQTNAQETSDFSANISLKKEDGSFINPVNMYRNPDGGPSIGAITDEGWGELGRTDSKTGKFIHEAKILKILNSSNIASSYTDINTNKTERGAIVGINVDPEDGKISFSVRGKQGLVPKTLGFSNDPNDVVLFTNPNDMKDQLNTILLGQQAIRSKGAVTLGAASQQGIAAAEDKNAQETIAAIEEQVANGEITPKDGAEQLEIIREAIKNGIANLEEEKTNPGETPKEAVNRDGTIEQRLPGTRNLAMQDDVSGANQEQGVPTNVQELIEMDKFTSNKIDTALTTTGRGSDLLNAQKEFSDELLVQLGYLDADTYNKIKDNESLPASRRKVMPGFKRQQLRKKALGDYMDAKAEANKPEGTSDVLKDLGISKEVEEKYNLPSPDFTDMAGLEKYATDNEASLKLIGTDENVLNKIKEVLTKYDVKEEKDLSKIPAFEFGPRFGMMEIAAGIAAAASGQEAFLSTFNTMANMFGSGGATNMDESKFAQDNAQFLINQSRMSSEFRQKQTTAASKAAAEKLITRNETFTNTLRIKANGDPSLSILSPLRAEGSIAAFNATMQQFYISGGRNGAPIQFDDNNKPILSSTNKEAYEIVKTTMGQALFGYAANSGNKKFGDWFRQSAQETLGNQLDRVKYTTAVRGKPPKRYIESINFYDGTGKRTDTRLNGIQLEELFGDRGSRERGILMDFLTEDKG